MEQLNRGRLLTQPHSFRLHFNGAQVDAFADGVSVSLVSRSGVWISECIHFFRI